MNDGTRVRVKPTGETGTIRYTLICDDLVVVLDGSRLANRYKPYDVEPLLEREELSDV